MYICIVRGTCFPDVCVDDHSPVPSTNRSTCEQVRRLRSELLAGVLLVSSRLYMPVSPGCRWVRVRLTQLAPNPPDATTRRPQSWRSSPRLGLEPAHTDSKVVCWPGLPGYRRDSLKPFRELAGPSGGQEKSVDWPSALWMNSTSAKTGADGEVEDDLDLVDRRILSFNLNFFLFFYLKKNIGSKNKLN